MLATNRLTLEVHPKISGFSGTSAGALCALMVWYGLAPKAGRPGSAAEAIKNINTFWDTFASEPPAEIVQSAFAQFAPGTVGPHWLP